MSEFEPFDPGELFPKDTQDSGTDAVEEFFLVEIARLFQEGFVTDDNPSEGSRLTGLDQAIIVTFDVYTGEQILSYKRRVLGIVSDLNGGSYRRDDSDSLL